MSSLYARKTKVKNNFDNKNWTDIIKDVYSSNFKRFKFQLNSELVDVENRFRLVVYNGIKYVIKKTTKRKALIELENSKKLYNVMIHYEDEKYKIIPIIPYVEFIEEYAYLISKYEGNTLQENLYNGNKLSLKFIDFINIFNYMFDNKIVYRGFIPRNIIIKNNIIYLIDFEDIVFLSEVKLLVNLNFYINIILNWQYFYSYDDINKFFNNKEIKYKENFFLNNYEKQMKSMLKFSGNNENLRNEIKKIVLLSEKPTIIKEDLKEDYIIMPTDLCHLFSDLTNYEYDAFFDLINYNIRKTDEKMFVYYLKLFSRIVYLYNDNIEKLRLYILIIFILYLENCIDEKNKISIKKNFSINNLNNLIRNSSSICKLVLEKEIEILKIEYLELIKNSFKFIIKNKDIDNNLTNNINLFLIDIVKNY